MLEKGMTKVAASTMANREVDLDSRQFLQTRDIKGRVGVGE